MPRTVRVAPGGLVFHVLNRGVARMQLFEKPADYEAFGQVMREALDESSMQICACTAMPNHWHLLLWPECDDELATFVQRLTITHVRRWQRHWGYAGLGHVYQGRYKSFPVESEEHFWARCPLRLVQCAARESRLERRKEIAKRSGMESAYRRTGRPRKIGPVPLSPGQC
jgi:putative transposase